MLVVSIWLSTYAQMVTFYVVVCLLFVCLFVGFDGPIYRSVSRLISWSIDPLILVVLWTDEDECMMGKHQCHVGQQCRNLIGGYECVMLCPTGYRQREDGSCVGQ